MDLPHNDDGKLRDLARLNQRQRFKHFIAVYIHSPRVTAVDVPHKLVEQGNGSGSRGGVTARTNMGWTDKLPRSKRRFVA